MRPCTTSGRMTTHLEAEEIEFLKLLRDTDHRAEPSAHLVRVLIAKGLLFPTNNNLFLLTSRAIDLLDGSG
jgi:hypothetical protein